MNKFCLRLLSVFIVCSETPFSKNECHIETYQVIWSINQLTGLGFRIIRVFTERYFQTDIKFLSFFFFFWGLDVLNLFIFSIGKLSYSTSVRMSSRFIEIVKPLQNITEGCVSCIQYTPLEKEPIKIFESLYVREYKQVTTWNKGLFQYTQECFVYRKRQPWTVFSILLWNMVYKSVGAAIRRLFHIF